MRSPICRCCCRPIRRTMNSRIRLAGYYVGDSRPRKAIELLTQVLDGIRDENDPEQKEDKGRGAAGPRRRAA